MSKQTKFTAYKLLGLYVDAITMDQTNEYVGEWAGDHSKPSCYVIKPYVEFLDRAHNDPELLKILNDAELSLPDGVALSWATTFLYATSHSVGALISTLASIVLRPARLKHVLPDRFAGANATWSLLKYCEQHHLKVYLVGSPKSQSIDDVATTVKTKLPGIEIAGTAAGFIDGMRGAELLHHIKSGFKLTDLADKINSSSADVVLIGMGFPLQEYVMASLQPLVTRGVMIGEGGTFDYDSFGGQMKRAPAVVQKLGLEWLWRLVLEPKRIVRQLAIPRFIWSIWRSRRT